MSRVYFDFLMGWAPKVDSQGGIKMVRYIGLFHSTSESRLSSLAKVSSAHV